MISLEIDNINVHILFFLLFVIKKDKNILVILILLSEI